MPRKATKVKAVPSRSNFAGLVQAVHLVHAQGAAAASRAVNMSLTLRNWLIGMHIYEYEQGGADRAKYGQHLLARLSQALEKKKIRGADIRALTHYRRFYLTGDCFTFLMCFQNTPLHTHHLIQPIMQQFFAVVEQW